MIKCYFLLYKLNNKDKHFIKKLNNINDIHLHIKFKKYLNKKNIKLLNDNYCIYLSFKKIENLFVNTIDVCCVCSEKNYMITLNYKHLICPDCYSKSSF